MPKNTAAGPIISLFATILGFALVWHIWWLAIVGALGVFVSFLARIFNDDVDYYVPASEVELIEREHHKRLAQAVDSDHRGTVQVGNMGVQS